MLVYLSGKVIRVSTDYVIIKVTSGEGYLVNVSPDHSYLVNETVTVFIHEVRREDRLDLYGFNSWEERDWIIKLTKVSGVGPKIAALIIYTLGYQTVLRAISQSEPKILAQVKGLGVKTAKKIVLELKGEATDLGDLEKNVDSENTFTSEYVETLSGLGYKRGEIVSSISKLKREQVWDESNLVETVRRGLKALGRG